jgi:hypothetical protein
MSGSANLITDHRLLTKEIGEQFKERFGATPIAVVLDTLNKSLHGSENKDLDMGNYIRAAEAIKEAFGCVVIIVHHCGWDETRFRGHSSLKGGADAVLAVTRDCDVVTVTVKDMRDGPEGAQIVARKHEIEVGEDAGGRPLTSVVLVPHEPISGHATKQRDWPASLKVFRKALVEATLSLGFDHKIEGGPTVKAVELQHVRAAFYRLYAVASDDAVPNLDQLRDAKKKAFARALEKAQAQHLVGAWFDGTNQIVWLVSPFEGGYAPSA